MNTRDTHATRFKTLTGRRYTSVRCALMALLGLLVPLAAQAQAFLLGPRVPLADSTLDSDAVTGDFNGDGRDDVAFCLGDLYVTVKLQDENGELVTAHEVFLWRDQILFQSTCRRTMVADLDDDGNDDLVIMHSNGITTFLSKPSGLIRDEHEIPYESNLNTIASAGLLDVDEDGRLDLIGLAINGRVRVWNGSTPGQWAPEALLTQSGFEFGLSLAVLDVGGDGRDDFALLSMDDSNASGNPQRVLEVFARSDSGFVARQATPVPGGELLEAGDITGDGLDDLLINGVVAIEQRPNGAFAEPRRYDSLPIPNAAVIEDLNGDGLADVAVAHNGWEIVSTYRQREDGLEFQSYNLGLSNLNRRPQALAAGDFDSDGCKDIIAAVAVGYHLMRGIDCISPLDLGLSADEKVLRGTWYEPETSGQGLMVDVITLASGEKIVYVGWYTFRRAFAPTPTAQRWLVASGASNPQRNAETGLIEQTLDLYVTADGAGRFNQPHSADVQRVGTLTLQLISNTEVIARFHFDSPIETYPQTSEVRLIKLPDQELVAGPERDLRGTWFNPQTSGQGVMVDVLATGKDARALAASWYTYDRSGRQLWLFLQGPFSPGATEMQVDVYLSTGGNFILPPIVTPERVGSARVRRVDTTRMRIDVDFDRTDPRWTDTQLDLIKLDTRTTPTQRATP